MIPKINSQFLQLQLMLLLAAYALSTVPADNADEVTVQSKLENVTKFIDIDTLNEKCDDFGKCINFNYPNKYEIAFFRLKPQIRILDETTYVDQIDTLVFEDSIFAQFPLHLFYSINVRELDMRNCSIEILTWQNFLMADKLRILLLSHNKLQAITEMTFNYASELQYLFLDANQIRTLVSESFKGLKELRFLELSNNRLRDLPGTVFADLHMLNELHLEGNRLGYLPNEIFSRNSELTKVVLRDNRLQTLDEYLFRHQPSLLFVDLSNNENLLRLIMNIQTKYLIAANCSLYLVNLYGQIANADLRDNEIVELYFAQPESLEKLVLRNNALQQIASLTRAVNLRELNVADNPGLEFLPDPWSVTSLERLDLSNTSLHNIPISNLAEQANLRFLNVSNNNIQEINPENFRYLERLTHFDIAANDWNCYNLRIVMDFLIKPNRIGYKHDPFDAEFPGEYVEGVACMYRIEDDGNSVESSLNGLLKSDRPQNGQLVAQETSNSYESTNEYPTNGSNENQLLKREIESLRRELKAIVTFYESKFDMIMSGMGDLNKRLEVFEKLNREMFDHIIIRT